MLFVRKAHLSVAKVGNNVISASCQPRRAKVHISLWMDAYKPHEISLDYHLRMVSAKPP